MAGCGESASSVVRPVHFQARSGTSVSSSFSSTSISRVRCFRVDNHFESPSTAMSRTPQMKFEANAEPDQLPSAMGHANAPENVGRATLRPRVS